jgi:hypothetical protein
MWAGDDGGGACRCWPHSLHLTRDDKAAISSFPYPPSLQLLNSVLFKSQLVTPDCVLNVASRPRRSAVLGWWCVPSLPTSATSRVANPDTYGRSASEFSAPPTFQPRIDSHFPSGCTYFLFTASPPRRCQYGETDLEVFQAGSYHSH